MPGDPLREEALCRDREDMLAPFKKRFFHSSESVIYLDGNSLGRMPLAAVGRMEDLMKRHWGERLIRSWNENWIHLPRTVADKIAGLLGADPGEVMVGDSTSINLYKLAFAALKFQGGRKKIVSDALNFPTDLYVLQGLVKGQFPGHYLEIIESRDGISIAPEQFREALDEDTALLTLSHVNYKSASLNNMAEINRMADENGALVIWDLSHSAGAVPVRLSDTGSHLAVGCTYKYLNGGPGAPACLYVKKELQEKLFSPVWGWFGHRRPFEFDPEYEAAPTVDRFSAGTPHILSLAPVETGVDILLEAGMENLRRKSMAQTEYLTRLIREFLLPFGFELGSPREPERRGSHVSVRHTEGFRINRAMIHPLENEIAVIPDFRPPDNIRLGIAPLYISFEDIYLAVRRMEDIVRNSEYKKFSTESTGVT